MSTSRAGMYWSVDYSNKGPPRKPTMIDVIYSFVHQLDVWTATLERGIMLTCCDIHWFVIRYAEY